MATTQKDTSDNPDHSDPDTTAGAAADGRTAEQIEKERKQEEAREALRAMKPWKGKATRQDKALLFTVVAIPAFFMALTPLKPFLIAEHPVGLAFVTGSNAAVGAASAFARIGEIPLWLVIVAGVVGKIKVDWLFWWVGRLWGRGFVNLIAQGDKAQRFADRAEDMNPWIIRAAVPLSYLPGVPALFVYVIAGWTGMRLRTFLLLDALGALILTSTVAGIGYAAGQTGVDIVLAVDRYALWVTLAIVFVMAFLPVVKQMRRAKAEEAAKARKAAEAEQAGEPTPTDGPDSSGTNGGSASSDDAAGVDAGAPGART
ncbi:DedA family protein [Nocardiopsis sp. NPDC058631]|uniref:DedA family protein n=1 Tax=Nocardiopsis sp. NPDC058631 TaxID=3346566 RepID=UPI00365FF079